tara:strand:+ start:461 stop:604 length:144 start_codon:yes stop_codon:yes gene_type:complete
MEELEWNEMSTKDLTQKMYDLIADNVRNGLVRSDMYDILDELEERID